MNALEAAVEVNCSTARDFYIASYEVEVRDVVGPVEVDVDNLGEGASERTSIDVRAVDVTGQIRIMVTAELPGAGQIVLGIPLLVARPPIADWVFSTHAVGCLPAKLSARGPFR